MGKKEELETSAHGRLDLTAVSIVWKQVKEGKEQLGANCW
jgi:hypothetical protein